MFWQIEKDMSFLFVHFCPETVPTGLPKASQVAPLPPVVDVEAWEMWSVSSFFKVIKLQTQWVDWVDVDKVDPWFSIGPIGPYWFHIVTLFHTWLVIDRKKMQLQKQWGPMGKGGSGGTVKFWRINLRPENSCGVLWSDGTCHWQLESIGIYQNLSESIGI